MIGQTISHYKILEKLGEGGMGVVYKAHDTKLDRIVALKFLPHYLASDGAEKTRFEHEARAAAALIHANITVLHEIDESEGQIFLAMEYVEGKTLKHLVGEEGILSIKKVLDIAIQVCEGLAAAHEKGIVHRDIKSDNIMISAKGQVKIMDFGLAKLKDTSKLTKTGSTLGTAAYMSPEQAQGEEVDARSDIFSLGVVLYELLTTKLPFRGEHQAALIYSLINEAPPPLARFNEKVTPEIERIVVKALAKDKEERYQHADDILADLRTERKKLEYAKAGYATAPRGDYQVVTLQEPSAAPRSRTAWIQTIPRKIRWTAAGVIVLIVCITGWLVFHSEPRRATFKAGHSSQLTSELGIKLDQAVSPDGKMIAYSAYSSGTLRIHVKQVAGGHTICLTDGIPGYQRLPQWSADGSEIAFYNPSSEESFIIPALGGAPRKAPNGICSPDGKQFVFASGDTVFLQAADGAQRRVLAVIKEPSFLSWSPDGSLIAFVSGNPFYRNSDFPANVAPSSICVISVQGGSAVQITDNSSLNTSPIWSSDGRYLFFVSNRDGTRDIYVVALGKSSRPEREPERLTTGLNAYTISISADSKMLTYSVLTHSANIWSIDIPRAKWVSVREATQVTTGNQVIEIPGVSADGQWLAYDCNRDGVQHIFKMLLKGGEPIQLTREPRDNFSPSWSPDGKMIAFHSFRTGNPEIFVMMNDGTNQQQVTHDPGVKRQPYWSPDGNHLVYYSNRSGQVEIYVVSRNSGTGGWESPRQITSGGVNGGPRWSPDGLWIAYINNGIRNSIRVISPQGGTPRTLVSDDDPSVSPEPVTLGWSQDSRTVYYKASDASFWAVPLEGGKPRLLVKFDDPTKQLSRPDFSTDGKRFFFTVSKYEGDIWKMDLIKEE